MNSKSAKILFDKGVQYLEQLQYETALQTFLAGEKIAKKTSEKGSFLYNIAICHLRLCQKERASEAIKKALINDPELEANFLADPDLKELVEPVTKEDDKSVYDIDFIGPLAKTRKGSIILIIVGILLGASGKFIHLENSLLEVFIVGGLVGGGIRNLVAGTLSLLKIRSKNRMSRLQTKD